MTNFGSKQIMSKIFKCLTCGEDIKLQRKDDDSGWNRYNIDGTPHSDQKKYKSSISDKKEEQQQPQQVQVPPAQAVQQVSDAPQIATLADIVTKLERRIDSLSEEVRVLAIEVQKNKK
jgi:hypothetical protein